MAIAVMVATMDDYRSDDHRNDGCSGDAVVTLVATVTKVDDRISIFGRRLNSVSLSCQLDRIRS